MFTGHYKDITELSYELTKRMVYAKPEELDVLNTMDFQLNNVMVQADSCEYDFDLKQVWVTRNRWTSLVRQYLDPIALNGFLEQVGAKLKGKKRGIAFLRTQMVKKRSTISNSKEWRRWGSCMLGFSYTALPKPHITLHSRTTYLGYIGQLDLALVHVLAREIGKKVGLEPKDIGFTWVIDGAQFHSFKSLAWFFQRERDMKMLTKKPHTEELKKRAPVLWRAQHRYAEYLKLDEDGILYCDMSFSQQLRIRRRLHTEVHGPEFGLPFEGGTRLLSNGMQKVAPPLPSVPVSELDFEPVFRIKVHEDIAEESETKAGFYSPEDEDDFDGTLVEVTEKDEELDIDEIDSIVEPEAELVEEKPAEQDDEFEWDDDLDLD